MISGTVHARVKCRSEFPSDPLRCAYPTATLDRPPRCRPLKWRVRGWKRWLPKRRLDRPSSPVFLRSSLELHKLNGGYPQA